MNIEEPYRAGMALGPGAYEVEVRAAGYETVRETVEHGTEATERRVVLAALPPQPFTVVTEPAGARIQIVNIEEPYRTGMALGPGAYEVEVSAAGYTSVRETIEHGTEGDRAAGSVSGPAAAAVHGGNGAGGGHGYR